MNKAGALVLGAVLLMLPLADAHGGASPRPQDTRLMHDHNDDCGGDGVTSNCRGSTDLIALDVQEHHKDGADQVTFRFLADKGQAGAHKVVLGYDAGGARKSLEFTTTDYSSFGGSFSSVKASPAGDGARIFIDATASPAQLGVSPGMKISAFRVEAWRDGTLGDFMPGGYQGPLGPVANPPQGDAATNTVRPDYTMRGPTYYVALDPAGGAVKVRNLLDTAQSVTLKIAGDGASWATGGDTMTLDLARKGSSDARFSIAPGTAPAAVSVTATTDLGGRTMASVPHTGAASDAPSPSTSPPTTPTPTKDASALAMAAVMGGLFLLAARRR